MYFQLLLMTFTSWKPRGEASAMQAAGSAQTTSVPTADHRRARGHEPKTKQPRGGAGGGAGCRGNSREKQREVLCKPHRFPTDTEVQRSGFLRVDTPSLWG